MRADRMGIQSSELFLVTETSLEAILQHIETINPALVIVDSIQTTYTEELARLPAASARFGNVLRAFRI